MQKGERVYWHWHPKIVRVVRLPESLPAITLADSQEDRVSVDTHSDYCGHIAKTVNVDELSPRSKYVPRVDDCEE